MAKFLWTQKQDIGPSRRYGHAMVYDARRRRTVLFGGTDQAKTLNDTWEWDGENWSQITDLGPRARFALAMAYDSKRGRTVLFGGKAGQNVILGDTWEWDGENWTQVEDRGPVPRSDHAMAFDLRRNRVVLFGGDVHGVLDADNRLAADTWEWDGEQWTQTGEAGPAARVGHAMAFDPVKQRLIMFGGMDGPNSFNDTWGWDGVTWTQVADIGPQPCHQTALVTIENRLALFGGQEIASQQPKPPVYGNTWEWDGKRWVQRSDFGPPPRWGHAMVYDSARRQIVLFGGLSVAETEPVEAQIAGLLGDTWEHAVTPDQVVNEHAGNVESFTLSPNTAPFEQIAGGGFHIKCIIRLNAPLNVPFRANIIADFLPIENRFHDVNIPPAVMDGSVDIQLPNAGIIPGNYAFRLLHDDGVVEAMFSVT